MVVHKRETASIAQETLELEWSLDVQCDWHDAI